VLERVVVLFIAMPTPKAWSWDPRIFGETQSCT